MSAKKTGCIAPANPPPLCYGAIPPYRMINLPQLLTLFISCDILKVFNRFSTILTVKDKVFNNTESFQQLFNNFSTEFSTAL